MDIEGIKEASWEEQKKKMGDIKKSQDFHLESKVDPVEALIERVGWDDALAQIQENFDNNPDDQEARRQAALIVKLYDERVKPLREKLEH